MAAVAVLCIFSSCKKEEGATNPNWNNNIKLEIVKCTPYATEVYVQYKFTIPSDVTGANMMGIVCAGKKTAAEIAKWDNPNATRGGLIEALQDAEGKYSQIYLTPNTEYTVLLAVTNAQGMFIKVSEPKYITTPAE